MEPWVIILLVIVGVIVGLIALFLIFIFINIIFAGAMVMFAFALHQGFIGVAAYIACWVVFFPVMLVISGILGALGWWANRHEM